jgi:ribosomal protein S4
VTASSFCRRRLPVVMVRAKMAQSVKSAVQLVESGHVRVWPETVLDPAFLVPRALEVCILYFVLYFVFHICTCYCLYYRTL